MDVIIEHRKTKVRKTATPKAAKLLNVEWRTVGTVEPPKNGKKADQTEIEQLREDYLVKFGKAAHHKLGVDKLKELLAE
jgi:hypothetical protein